MDGIESTQHLARSGAPRLRARKGSPPSCDVVEECIGGSAAYMGEW